MAQRMTWPSQWIFILAAIGSAAGLGNLWRFPALAYEHGGGAFVFAIIIANLVIGIPLLILEIALGQKTGKAAPDAFGTIRKSLKYVGWAAVALSFIVLTYYMAVVSWSFNFFAASFSLAWADGAKDFFFGTVLHISDGVDNLGGFSWPVVMGLGFSWIMVYLCAWRGVHSVSAVVKYTATLPFLILIILLIRAVTLPGAGDGIAAFLVPQWDSLRSPELWLAAFSQVFFSLSIAFGAMIAYGSFNKRHFDITKSAIWIAAGNFAVSILSGFVVFGTLGYMSLVSGTPLAEVAGGGPGLAFVVFPEAISLMPAFNALIGVLFFGTLLTLAVDSAFALLEAIAAAVRNRFPNTSPKKIAFWTGLVTAIVGLVYAREGGLYVLDIVDHYVVSYGLVIIGLLEAIIVTWIWKGSEIVEYVNENARYKIGWTWINLVKFAIPAFLLWLLWVNIQKELEAPYEGYPEWALWYLGVLPIVLAPIVGYFFDKFAKQRV